MYREVMKLLGQCMIVLLVAITLSSCDNVDIRSRTASDKIPVAGGDVSKVEKMLAGGDGQLVYINDYTLTKKAYRVPYLDYDELCLKEGEERLTTGKYANITPDGKIDWGKKDKLYFFEKNDAKEIKMDELISIDGRPIRLPIKFIDLGEEYAIFDKIDFSLMEDATLFPVTIIDTKTGTSLSALSNKFYEEDGVMFSMINRNSELVLRMNVRLENGGIIHISSSGINNLSLMNIKVGEIQLGSTLNEAYEKLGSPWVHWGKFHDTGYLYRDEERKYGVKFYSDGRLYDPENPRKLSKGANTITEIRVTLY